MAKPKSLYLSDYWTKQDALNFQVFLPALMDILQNAETPLTLGVFGSWGSGKTSLLRMLEGRIHDQGLPSFRSTWFTAWKYGQQESLWRAFILRVIDGLYPVRDGKRISLDQIKDKDQKEGVDYLERLGLSLYEEVTWQGDEHWSLNLGKASLEAIKLPIWLALHLAQVGGVAEGLGIKPDLGQILAREAKTYYMAQLESMEQFEAGFETALRLILGEDGRLVVFVDDLDRCLPEKAIEILEAIKLFLNVPQTVFVLGMDREIVRRGIESHYGVVLRPAAGENAELPINGDAYLQKMIQIPFNLPPLDASSRIDFIQNLEAQNSSFAGLDDITRKVFARGLLPNSPPGETRSEYLYAAESDRLRARASKNASG